MASPGAKKGERGGGGGGDDTSLLTREEEDNRRAFIIQLKDLWEPQSSATQKGGGVLLFIRKYAKSAQWNFSQKAGEERWGGGDKTATSWGGGGEGGGL